MNTSLASRVFAVTGGGSGIGAATAKCLAKQGATAIWIVDRDNAGLTSIAKDIEGTSPKTKIFFQNLDVANSTEVRAWINKIVKTSGGLHGAVNVAGISQALSSVPPGSKVPSILSQTDEEFDRIIKTNLYGAF
ncbi:2,3-dihydro-2,3-dihydroxybenzoate dehydrogenase [Colletotrichum fioriniae PJ7]|uniref:2,3-dihydro-2,3-dihydroxybenzoate dehydrogenase n=1 Tax=Colletotrichum fioriniae PJ7 TaxID=1445577 RepID=A0A010RGJ8_9PEZI|nr:2,3-dihydro-2,3-dihydroxybenzoate dehydrogenase [Colletotrichum fioriniae PJ7]